MRTYGMISVTVKRLPRRRRDWDSGIATAPRTIQINRDVAEAVKRESARTGYPISPQVNAFYEAWLEILKGLPNKERDDDE